MQRRGPGLAAFDRFDRHNQYAQLSNMLTASHVANLHSQLEIFRSQLSRFAIEHRQKIVKDPSFRHQFQRMCADIGVDPLAGPRRGGWWSEVLGVVGDWQYELGVQIVDICVSTRERNGGMIEMGELVRLLTRLRGGGEEVTEEDVVRSIKTLTPLGAGYEVVEVSGIKMVRSVVKELDSDGAVVLGLAQEADVGGRVTEESLVRRKGWEYGRARAALENMLLRDGLCWVDEQDPQGRSFWIPSALVWEE
ncbi:EAP30/Vps36 family-domain-containing protein [Hysterangium stoloniferum]|nr:EAP30/Vps36 family-domain-containing protein [Hysterangium stoloniferum]